MTFSIRPCAPEDAAMLALVAQATFLETFAGMLPGEAVFAHCRDKLSEAAHARWLAEPDARLWLAQAQPGDAPIGYAGLAAPDLPLPDPAPGDIELKRIYVLSRFHGGGVGPALMQAAVAEAKAMGRRRLLLGVYDQNARAIAYYRKAGFSEIGARKFQVGATLCNDLVMAKDLRSDAP
jgi:ribosomal protein S18 acetylase RimI-like enzyme